MPLKTERSDITLEELTEVSSLSSLGFAPQDICICLSWGEEIREYMETCIDIKDSGSPLMSAYYKGRLETEIKLREAIRQASYNGSNPAQNTMIDYLNNSKS